MGVSPASSPHHRFEQQSRIVGTARHRSVYGSNIPGQRDRISRDHSGRRAQADDPTKRRRNAQRAAKIGAFGERQHARRQRGGPTAARTPTLRARSQGLRVAPNTRLTVLAPAPNSGVLVLPTTMAPACLIRFTTAASSLGV